MNNRVNRVKSPIVVSYCDADEFDFFPSNNNTTNISNLWPSTVTSLDDNDEDMEVNDGDALTVLASADKVDYSQHYNNLTPKTWVSTSYIGNASGSNVIDDLNKNANDVIIINSDDEDLSQGGMSVDELQDKSEQPSSVGAIHDYNSINSIPEDIRKVCGIEDCHNTESQIGENSSTTLFTYPDYDPELNQKWIEFTSKASKNDSNSISNVYTYICSDHFDQVDLEPNLELERLEGIKRYKLKEGAFPVIIKKFKLMNKSNNKSANEANKCVENSNEYMNKVENIKLLTENPTQSEIYLSKTPVNDFQMEFLNKVVKPKLINCNEDILPSTKINKKSLRSNLKIKEQSPIKLRSGNRSTTTVNRKLSKTITSNELSTSKSSTTSTSPIFSSSNNKSLPMISTSNKLLQSSISIGNKLSQPAKSMNNKELTHNKSLQRSTTNIESYPDLPPLSHVPCSCGGIRTNPDVKARESIKSTQSYSKSTQTSNAKEETNNSIIEHYKEEIRKFKRIVAEKDRVISRLTKVESTALSKEGDWKQKYSLLQDKLSTLQLKAAKLVEEKRLHSEKIRNDIIKTLKNTFTENQINMLLDSKEKCQWKLQEIFEAYKLKQMSSDDAYLYLVKDMKYPLPPLSALKFCLSVLQLDFSINGICPKNFELMEIFAQTKSDLDKVTVLSLNEFGLESLYGYSEDSDQIVSPQKSVQILMAYGLYSNWRQPVYINYNNKINKDLLFSLIETLNKINYNVVALVTDCKKYKLWKELQITIKKPYFELDDPNSKLTKKKVFVYFDASDILRIMRYWYLESGFILKDKTAITKELFIELIENRPVEAEILYGYTSKHLNHKKRSTRRREIKYAEDMISDNGGYALKELGIGDSDVCEFFECIDIWYKFVHRKSKTSIYTGSVQDNIILDRLYEMIKQMRHATRSKPLNYQKAILISIESLKALWSHLAHFNSGIPLDKLNLKCAESFYKDLKKYGDGLKPTAFELPKLIQKLLLDPIHNKNPTLYLDENNTLYSKCNDEYVSVNILLQYSISTQAQLTFDPVTGSVISDNSTPVEKNIDKDFASEDDSFRYIIYWIVRQLQSKVPKLAAPETEVLHVPSEMIENEIVRPSKWWIENAKILENEFILYHRVGLRRKSVMKSLIKIIIDKYKTIPKEIIEMFIRQRTLIRLAFLNKNTNSKILLKRKQHLEKLKEKYEPKIIINNQILLPSLQQNINNVENIDIAQNIDIAHNIDIAENIDNIVPNEIAEITTDGFFQNTPTNQKFLPVLLNIKEGTISQRPHNFDMETVNVDVNSF